MVVEIRQVGQHVDDLVPSHLLVEIRVDEKLILSKASADAVKLSVYPVLGVGVAQLEDRLDGLEEVLGEAGAELVGGLLGGIEGDGEEGARGREGVVLGDAIAAVDATPEDEDQEDDGARAKDGHATEALVEHHPPGADRAGGGPDVRHGSWSSNMALRPGEQETEAVRLGRLLGRKLDVEEEASRDGCG